MKKLLTISKPNLIVLSIITLLGLSLRLYGINWDQSQHLHPDERFLTMVTQALHWPTSLISYLNPRLSPLNPYNIGYGFYVYGMLPLVLVKFASSFLLLNSFDYNNITLIGRLASALFDTATIFLVYKIGKKIFNTKIGLVATFIYATCVLPIQLSHFFAVDTFLTFFLTLTFYLVLVLMANRRNYVIPILLGLSLGLAFATKISSVLILPIIVIALLKSLTAHNKLSRKLVSVSLITLCSYLTLRFADGHLFANSNLLKPMPNPQFISNISQLQSWSNSQALYPPAIQWIKTKPLIFPLKNIMLWGLGFPLGILSILGLYYAMWNLLQSIWKKRLILNPLKLLINIKTKDFMALIVVIWILFVFSYEGIQFSKSMRYVYPIYPFLAILAANFLYECGVKLKNAFKSKTPLLIMYSAILILILVWPFSFISIYSKPHTRVAASDWIYKNIPAGSTISCEYWDDCLPLPLGDQNSLIYKTETLTLFDPDTPEKWSKATAQLRNVDYLILSSNRLWGSIPKVPERYPLTTSFYTNLFAGKLNFEKVAEFTSYPTIPFTNVQIPDDSAEEAFTVYDHPKVLIFKRIIPY